MLSSPEKLKTSLHILLFSIEILINILLFCFILTATLQLSEKIKGKVIKP